MTTTLTRADRGALLDYIDDAATKLGYPTSRDGGGSVVVLELKPFYELRVSIADRDAGSFRVATISHDEELQVVIAHDLLTVANLLRAQRDLLRVATSLARP